MRRALPFGFEHISAEAADTGAATLPPPAASRARFAVIDAIDCRMSSGALMMPASFMRAFSAARLGRQRLLACSLHEFIRGRSISSLCDSRLFSGLLHPRLFIFADDISKIFSISGDRLIYF